MIKKAMLLIFAALLANELIYPIPTPQINSKKPSSKMAIPEKLDLKVDALFSEYDRSDSPGLAIVVVRDGKVLLRKCYGLASIEHRVPITPSTVFNLGSLAKQFTGFVASSS